MIRHLSFIILGAVLALGLVEGASAVAGQEANPQQLVEDSAKRMLTELDANRAMYRSDPAKLDHLIATVLLPNFDIDYSARLVLGQNWRNATEDQRKRFVDAFYHALLRNYGSALVEFTAERMTVLPYRGDPGSKFATVRTEISRSDGRKVPVNYSLHMTEAGWKAWDVTIEGVSYIKSLRTDIGSEVQQKGLEAVIQRLENESKVSASGSGGTGRGASSKAASPQ